MQKRRPIISTTSLVLGLATIFGLWVSYVYLKDYFDFLLKNNKSNHLDFWKDIISLFLTSLSSVFIAYSVAKYEFRLADRNEQKKNSEKNNGKIRMLILEMDDNISLLETGCDDEMLDDGNVELVQKQLSIDIWQRTKEVLVIDEECLTKLFISNKNLNYLIDLPPDKFRDSVSTILEEYKTAFETLNTLKGSVVKIPNER